MSRQPKMTSDMGFGDADLGPAPDDLERRARLVRQWVDNISLRELKGRQREMVSDTSDRLNRYGDQTHFSEAQFYYIRGIYERQSGEEVHDRY
jgi:hypothetical protein